MELKDYRRVFRPQRKQGSWTTALRGSNVYCKGTSLSKVESSLESGGLGGLSSLNLQRSRGMIMIHAAWVEFNAMNRGGYSCPFGKGRIKPYRQVFTR